MYRTVALCRLDELPERGARGFDPLQQGEDTLFVIRRGRSVYAYRDLCPHYGNTALPWRKDAYLDPTGETIVCAAHGAHFEIATGLCISGPCLGESLTRVALEVDDAGQVLAIFSDENGAGENP